MILELLIDAALVIAGYHLGRSTTLRHLWEHMLGVLERQELPDGDWLDGFQAAREALEEV